LAVTCCVTHQRQVAALWPAFQKKGRIEIGWPAAEVPTSNVNEFNPGGSSKDFAGV
jgi:hypothetical protein